MYDDLIEDVVLCSFLADVVQAWLGYLDDVELHVEHDVAFVLYSSHVDPSRSISLLGLYFTVASYG